MKEMEIENAIKENEKIQTEKKKKIEEKVHINYSKLYSWGHKSAKRKSCKKKKRS